jgi:hypothetical protein
MFKSGCSRSLYSDEDRKKKKKSPLDWPNSVEIIPVNIFFSASFPLDVKCVFLY